MTYVFALLSQDDYPNFVALPDNDFPKVFEEWLRLNSKHGKEMRKQGLQLETLEISANQFIAHCRAHKAPYTVQNLRACTQDIFAARNKV